MVYATAIGGFAINAVIGGIGLYVLLRRDGRKIDPRLAVATPNREPANDRLAPRASCA